jgi:hypothetical protein
MHPVKRFLGVDDVTDPLEVLGITPEEGRSRVRIEAALRARLEQTYRHPAGRTDEGDFARRCVREASSVLINALQRPPAPPTPPPAPAGAPKKESGPTPLTEFDRYVLATLLGAGGWNAQSRAKIVALAGAYGVSPQGLMKVLRGIGTRARSGGPRLGVADITSGSSRLADPAGAAHAALPMLHLPELPAEPPPTDVATTIKLSMVFGLVTIVLGIVALRVVLPGGGEGPTGVEPGVTAPALAPPRLTPAAPVTGSGPAVAVFRPLPTFLGNALPAAATDAADACPRLPRDLDRVARTLAATEEPSLALLKDWEVSIATIASGWVLADDSTRRDVMKTVFDVMHETSDAPTTSDQLLEQLAPPFGRLQEPIDVWRGAWKTGALGALAANASLPSSVVDQARRQLSVALDVPAVSVPTGFDAAAGAWLEQQARGLVEVMEYEDDYEDFWEMWLAAQRRIGTRADFDGALLAAADAIMATDTNLSRPGRSANVLGRLLVLADFERSPIVRARVRGFFDDRDRISTHDLWVLTSLLAQSDTAPWFEVDLVMPAEDGDRFRRRVRDQVLAAWPAVAVASPAGRAADRAIVVDPILGGRWVALLEEDLGSAPGVYDDERVASLLRASRLNEAAALLAAGKTVQAEKVIAALEEADAAEAEAAAAPAGTAPAGAAPARPEASPRRTPPGPGGRPRPGGVRTVPTGSGSRRPIGQAVGVDGQWRIAYDEAGRGTEERMVLLRTLRTSAGSDLGPLDAEVFVREVYRGSPAELRAFAQSIVSEQFAAGPNVCMELLDQFPDAPKTERVSETLRRLTGRVLPPARSDSWRLQARMALLEHVLKLRRHGASPVDDVMEPLVESYLARASLLRAAPPPAAVARAPQDAARLLAEAWAVRAASTMTPSPIPDDLAALRQRHDTRRRLVTGPIQAMVAEQIAVLNYLAYVAVAERAGAEAAVVDVLGASADARRDADHVLLQAVMVERATAALWRLRLDTSPEEEPTT